MGAPKTKGGYDFYEVASALQKEIRRANEQEAMFWALELIPRFDRFLWRRLTILVHEDIGLANPMLMTVVPENRRLFFEYANAGRDGSCRLVLANTILLMARSAKSRLADHFQCSVNQARLQGEMTLEIPDYALGKHTRRGKQKGRGLEHWLEEGCQLVNEIEEIDGYKDEAARLWANQVDSDWYEKGDRKNSRRKKESATGDLFG